MRYVVFVKQVPDTDSLEVDENGILIRDGSPSILNQYCEEALFRTIAFKNEGDSILVVTMGPRSASMMLRRCLALGADEAVLLTDQCFAGADTWATSRVLAAFIQKYEPDADLYVFGRQATDGDTGQVPFEVAALLNAQQFAYVDSLESSDDGIVAEQDYDSFRRRAKVPKGSVIAYGKADPNGHLPSLSGFRSSIDSPIKELGRVDLGLGLYSVGLKGSLTRIVSTAPINISRKGLKVEIIDPNRGAELIIKELEAIR